jgi:hypothetical protein
VSNGSLTPEVVDLLRRLAAGVDEHNRRERIALQNTPESRAELEAHRRPLRKPPLAAYVRGCPNLASLLRTGVRIPGSYWTQVDDGVVEIACPCGQTPACVGNAPQFCVCDRAYIRVGPDVFVLFSPVATLPADEESDPA